ncbi:MAG TPA: glycine zipper domain-containing protein [Candidatus Limnocylindria bacterium]|nr:glycine zipper domain-containing protein [Candidatus Limnocylindria bacterium]
MRKSFSIQLTSIALVGTLLVGCENLPGSKGTQGAVIGGASGAAVGAAVGGSNNRGTGAIIGGVLGAAGGYVIGANSDKIMGKDKDNAEVAAQRAKSSPATAEQARTARTADVNNDGFVTLDEVAAMKDAGLTDREMLNRLEATGQVFDLTAEGKQYLRENGVSEIVIRDMQNLNSERREMLLQRLNQNQ